MLSLGKIVRQTKNIENIFLFRRQGVLMNIWSFGGFRVDSVDLFDSEGHDRDGRLKPHGWGKEWMTRGLYIIY